MNKIYPYTTPGNYTYDTDKIEVSGGLAQLKEDLTNVYAHYHLNESSGSSIPDSSGNGRNGTTINMEDSDWVTGKLGNCLQFDGVNEYVNCGDIASFERTDSFSIEFWFKTTTDLARLIITKGLKDGTYRGWVVATSPGGKIVATLYSSYSANNYLSIITSSGGFFDGTWHHVIFTYDGTSTASGCHIYIDNTDMALTIDKDNLSGTIINTANCQISGRQGVSALYTGQIDEVVIYDKELIQSEVTYRYNSGTGRENVQYYSDKPTIEPTILFDPAIVNSWDSFLETLGGGNEGSIAYNLYKVDKANKYYWNGSVWITGGDSDHYNSPAVVNANISAFDASPDKIGIVAYLISDGEQKVELDENQITYTENEIPLVNAGSNKLCKDNQSIAPFSDCSFSDPDGTIIKVEYKVDGEVDSWSQIPQGGYGTLLEAVQAWTYQFANIGVKTVRLQVTDDSATGGGATAEDSLTVTVSKYTITFNVKNAIGNHVSDFYFLDGDGSLPQLKSSPFTYEYNYKATPYETVFYKDDYVTSAVEVDSTDHTENVVLTEPIYEETSRIYNPIRIDVRNKESVIKTLVKGDTILFEVKIEIDITDWKIRAELWDDGTIDIKKATTNAGGSDLEIEVTDSTGGIFIVKINKEETTDILNEGWLEIEMETNEGKIYTVYKSILVFSNEKIKWVTP